MLSDRQKKILKLIVESYIRQAKPVSSNLCLVIDKRKY